MLMTPSSSSPLMPPVIQSAHLGLPSSPGDLTTDAPAVPVGGYYDPMTDKSCGSTPDLAATGQPYAFTKELGRSRHTQLDYVMIDTRCAGSLRRVGHTGRPPMAVFGPHPGPVIAGTTITNDVFSWLRLMPDEGLMKNVPTIEVVIQIARTILFVVLLERCG
jgi:hypothetical protein